MSNEPRRMPSIFSECEILKQNYDKCFTEFFQKFLAPNYRHQYAVNPCERLHEVYKECVEERLKKTKLYDLDLDELRKEVLNTDADRLKNEQNKWVCYCTNSLMEGIGGAHPSLAPEQETRFNQLERTLEQFQENARHMGVIASDFTSNSQDNFNKKIHTFVSGLQEIDKMCKDFQDVKVPIELLDVLDQGKNPQLYTKEVLERTLNKNKQVNGKIEMYKKFRASLLKELGEEMPEDTAKYRAIREGNANT